jgi:hypothetical protein
MMSATFVLSDVAVGGFKVLRSLLVMRQSTFRSALASVSHCGEEGGWSERTGQDRTGQAPKAIFYDGKHYFS